MGTPNYNSGDRGPFQPSEETLRRVKEIKPPATTPTGSETGTAAEAFFLAMQKLLEQQSTEEALDFLGLTPEKKEQAREVMERIKQEGLLPPKKIQEFLGRLPPEERAAYEEFQRKKGAKEQEKEKGKGETEQ